MDIGKIPKFDFNILDRSEVDVRAVAAGSDDVIDGSPANEMFLLRKGRVRVHKNGQTFGEIDEGGIFGEMALIDQAPRAATVTAIDDCEVVPIDERLFIKLVQKSPYFGIEVMRTLVARLRTMNDGA
jgi:CRP/FNR family cyclic AMP-dependent transcriptional regulator